MHFRFKPVEEGLSIDLVCERVVALGIDPAVLEGALQRLGMEVGCSARKESYNLLEALSYPIDDSFPRITHASFICGVLPAGVVQLEYSVDLYGLKSKLLKS